MDYGGGKIAYILKKEMKGISKEKHMVLLQRPLTKVLVVFHGV